MSGYHYHIHCSINCDLFFCNKYFIFLSCVSFIFFLLCFQQRYIIPDDCKSWVLQTIQSSWRTRKSRIKKTHYLTFQTNEERIENRPDEIPLESFKMLLEYWNDESIQVFLFKYAHSNLSVAFIFNLSDNLFFLRFILIFQRRAEKNSRSRSEYTDTHTVGPKSFAQIRNKMVCEVLIPSVHSAQYVVTAANYFFYFSLQITELI